MVALWEAFYVESKRFDLDTLRVANRSSTPASKISDFLRCSTISGGSGAAFPGRVGEFPGLGAGLKKTHIFYNFETASTFWQRELSLVALPQHMGCGPRLWNLDGGQVIVAADGSVLSIEIITFVLPYVAQ